MSPLSRSVKSITVHSSFSALYYGFYLEALLQFFPKSKLRFSDQGMPANSRDILAFKLLLGGKEMNFVIDAEDSELPDQGLLDWCQLYGKVNLPANETNWHSDKYVCLGPSFGIRPKSVWTTIQWLIQNQLAIGGISKKIRKKNLSPFYTLIKERLKLTAYKPGLSTNDYVFFTATLWKKEAQTNQFRANFIRAGRSTPGIVFEGGFAPRRIGTVEGFENETWNGRIGLPEYLQKMKRSMVAFNTPAVMGCHGWKLGEYLALGKVILSTPLLRALPAPLEHGKHICYTDGTEQDMRSALDMLQKNEGLRRSLEQNARAYFEQYVSPVASLRILFGKAGIEL
jgi:hypothetical protein